MAEALDTPGAQLPDRFQCCVPQRVLLWGVRCWAAYHDSPTVIREMLSRVFADNGLSEAAIPFAQLMTTLFAGLKRLPDIRCMRCPRLGKDEVALLALMNGSSSQTGVALLAALLNAEALRQCLMHADQIAQALPRCALPPHHPLAAAGAERWH